MAEQESGPLCSFTKYRTNVSVIALVGANIVPVYGVLFLGWDAFYIVLLYWAENLVVGFYNILKMALASVNRPIEHLGKLFIIPFFMVHYGGFTAVHGFFVLAMFRQHQPSFAHGREWPCFLVFLQMLLNLVRQLFSLAPPAMKYAIVALFASHGVSFAYNYLYKAEYATSRVDRLMGEPYARVVVMHIAILAGGFISMAIGSPAAVLLVLVAIKTVIDVKLHLRQHAKKQKPPQTADAA